MQKVSVTELRNHLYKYLERAQRGTEILVSLHRKIIARILPAIDKRKEAINKLKKLRRHSKMTDVISPIDEDWRGY